MGLRPLACLRVASHLERPKRAKPPRKARTDPPIQPPVVALRVP